MCACVCASVCVCVCVCVYMGLEAGIGVHFEYQVSTWHNCSLRGTKNAIPKTPKVPEHEAGSTHGVTYQRARFGADFPNEKFRIEETLGPFSRLSKTRPIITTIQD